MPQSPDTRRIRKDECCICGCREVAEIDPFGYPFCGADMHRARFLALGRAAGWPAISDGRYALDNSLQAWLLTAIVGTNVRVYALIGTMEDQVAS
jgi:hypothetical protein